MKMMITTMTTIKADVMTVPVIQAASVDDDADGQPVALKR